jgi:hypothetical protein
MLTVSCELLSAEVAAFPRTSDKHELKNNPKEDRRVICPQA